MKKAAYLAATFSGVIVLWSLVALQMNNTLLLPRPMDVGISALILWQSGDLQTHVLASLQRLLVGLAIGVPVGCLLGCLMGLSRSIDAIFNPYLRAFNAIPALALVPLSLLLLGVTEASRYSLLVYTITLVVTINARNGVRLIPQLRLRVGATLGLSDTATLFRIIIPSCFPSILTGIRTAIGLGVMVIVAAEMMGAESGLGFLIMQARSHFSMTNVLVGVLGLGFLSLALDRAFVLAVDWFFPRWSLKRRV
jgi:ABC-type nitrate/sulfonate/bicarbonate transport system permease component